MYKIAQLSEAQRKELFLETSAKKGMTPAIAEKDFWVTYVLGKIYDDKELASILIFKGGTSLSKVYGVIERFSEDIDLILDWSLLTSKDPKAERSKRQQEILNKEINRKATEYIATTLLETLRRQMGKVCEIKVNEEDPYVVDVGYPSAFDERYLRPEIRLEIGPLAEWMPNEKYSVTSYCAEVFPRLFEYQSCKVPTILAERTFGKRLLSCFMKPTVPKIACSHSGIHGTITIWQ